MLFICLFYRIVVVVASTVVVGVAVLMLLLVHGAWYRVCCTCILCRVGVLFRPLPPSLYRIHSHLHSHSTSHSPPPTTHTHTFGHCIANSIEHPFADNPPNTSLSLPFSNRSRYSYIVLWKCIAALKCNRWSPSNSRLFVLFLFVLAVVLLFMLPPLALAGGVHSLFSAALELFIEMLAPFWLESWKLFFLPCFVGFLYSWS